MNLARHTRAATAAAVGIVVLLTVASLTRLVLGARGLYGNIALALGPTPVDRGHSGAGLPRP
jgi:hypothetical protein